MNDTRYGHTSVGGGDQDQAERKDEGWRSRQGGDESREPGSRAEPTAPDPARDEPGTPPAGTNTQGGLAGIGEASDRVAGGLEQGARPEAGDDRGPRARDTRAAGTDQPPRMAGPLGPDPERPHLPEGAQDTDSRGSGAGGFDVGVNAKNVGSVHQGAREEDAD